MAKKIEIVDLNELKVARDEVNSLQETSSWGGLLNIYTFFLGPDQSMHYMRPRCCRPSSPSMINSML